MYRSWIKGCEGYLGCTVPGAKDVTGLDGMYRSWSKGCEGYLGCAGPGERGVMGTWGVQW